MVFVGIGTGNSKPGANRGIGQLCKIRENHNYQLNKEAIIGLRSNYLSLKLNKINIQIIGI